jgi:hypothetical protein
MMCLYGAGFPGAPYTSSYETVLSGAAWPTVGESRSVSDLRALLKSSHTPLREQNTQEQAMTQRMNNSFSRSTPSPRSSFSCAGPRLS